MSIKVLGISASPRISGNSDFLLEQALTAAGDFGADIEMIKLSRFKIEMCIECYYCQQTGQCKIQDDYQLIQDKLLEADRLIFATPVFFMTVSSGAKILIDRGQCLWAKKNILGQDIVEKDRDRRAMVIAVGGSRSKRQFESIQLTMSSYFDVLEMKYCYNLFVSQVDSSGQAKEHPTASKHAYTLGSKLITERTAPKGKPETIEL